MFTPVSRKRMHAFHNRGNAWCLFALWLIKFMRGPESAAENMRRRKETDQKKLHHEGKGVRYWDVLKYRNSVLSTLLSMGSMAYLLVLLTFVSVRRYANRASIVTLSGCLILFLRQAVQLFHFPRYLLCRLGSLRDSDHVRTRAARLWRDYRRYRVSRHRRKDSRCLWIARHDVDGRGGMHLRMSHHSFCQASSIGCYGEKTSEDGRTGISGTLGAKRDVPACPLPLFLPEGECWIKRLARILSVQVSSGTLP